MERRFVLSVMLLLWVAPVQVKAQFEDVVVRIEKIEVAEVSGDTLVMVTVDDDIDNVNYPCADTDTDRLLVAVLPGLNPGRSWQMLHATLLAALSRGGIVRIRMGDCTEYKPGRMAREVFGVAMHGS